MCATSISIVDQAAQLAELLRAKGDTLWQIAVRLNEAGYRTRREKEFQATTVQRLLPAASTDGHSA